MMTDETERLYRMTAVGETKSLTVIIPAETFWRLKEEAVASRRSMKAFVAEKLEASIPPVRPAYKPNEAK
jgi:hypothetical protein